MVNVVPTLSNREKRSRKVSNKLRFRAKEAEKNDIAEWERHNRRLAADAEAAAERAAQNGVPAARKDGLLGQLRSGLSIGSKKLRVPWSSRARKEPATSSPQPSTKSEEAEEQQEPQESQDMGSPGRGLFVHENTQATDSRRGGRSFLQQRHVLGSDDQEAGSFLDRAQASPLAESRGFVTFGDCPPPQEFPLDSSSEQYRPIRIGNQSICVRGQMTANVMESASWFGIGAVMVFVAAKLLSAAKHRYRQRRKGEGSRWEIHNSRSCVQDQRDEGES